MAFWLKLPNLMPANFSRCKEIHYHLNYTLFPSPYPIKVSMIIERSVFVFFKQISTQKATGSINVHMKLDIERVCCTIVRMEHSNWRGGGGGGGGEKYPAINYTSQHITNKI